MKEVPRYLTMKEFSVLVGVNERIPYIWRKEGKLKTETLKGAEIVLWGHAVQVLTKYRLGLILESKKGRIKNPHLSEKRLEKTPKKAIMETIPKIKPISFPKISAKFIFKPKDDLEKKLVAGRRLVSREHARQYLGWSTDKFGKFAFNNFDKSETIRGIGYWPMDFIKAEKAKNLSTVK